MTALSIDAALAAARTAFAARDDATVLAHLEPWVELPDTGDEIAGLAANAALRLDAPSRALPPLRVLLQRHPDNAAIRRSLSMACNNVGARATREDDLGGAERALTEALAVWPDNADALHNLAQLLVLRRDDSALDILRRLHALRPDDAETTLALADQELRRTNVDADRWTRALTAIADPAYAERLYLDAERLQDADALPAARAVYAHVAAITRDGEAMPGLRARIAAELALPAVHDDIDALHATRERFRQGVDTLHEVAGRDAFARTSPSLEQLRWSNFLLAYQGEDDRTLQMRYGAFLQRALLALQPRFAVAPVVPARATPRIGLLSSGFRHCTVGSYFGAWVGALKRAGFEVVVFAVGPGFDATTDALERDASHLVRIDGPIDAMAATVREAALDLLIFPDIGMDARTQVLAACRLAPRQLAAWGHPVTTGLGSIDGYLTCADMEPPDADAHYSERLHALPGIGTVYAFPSAPERHARAALGLPDGPLYLVPQSSFKIHPDNDAVLAAIATRDPRATLLTFASPARGADHKLALRLRAALTNAGADPDRQLLFRPHVAREHFLELCAACDVMIDTQRWSGGNATLDALRARVPVVTVPGRFMRGRQSAAMLTQIGLAGALVCNDTETQIARAISIANDGGARARLATHIADALPTLADGKAALGALVDTVRAQLAIGER